MLIKHVRIFMHFNKFVNVRQPVHMKSLADHGRRERGATLTASEMLYKQTHFVALNLCTVFARCSTTCLPLSFMIHLRPFYIHNNLHTECNIDRVRIFGNVDDESSSCTIFVRGHWSYWCTRPLVVNTVNFSTLNTYSP